MGFPRVSNSQVVTKTFRTGANGGGGSNSDGNNNDMVQCHEECIENPGCFGCSWQFNDNLINVFPVKN